MLNENKYIYNFKLYNFFKIIIIKAYYYCAIEREIKRLNFLRLMVMYRVEIKMKYSTPKIIF